MVGTNALVSKIGGDTSPPSLPHTVTMFLLGVTLFNSRNKPLSQPLLCFILSLPRGVIVLLNESFGLEPVPHSTSNEHHLYPLGDVASGDGVCGVANETPAPGRPSPFDPGHTLTSLLRVRCLCPPVISNPLCRMSMFVRSIFIKTYNFVGVGGSIFFCLIRPHSGGEICLTPDLWSWCWWWIISG